MTAFEVGRGEHKLPAADTILAAQLIGMRGEPRQFVHPGARLDGTFRH